MQQSFYSSLMDIKNSSICCSMPNKLKVLNFIKLKQVFFFLFFTRSSNKIFHPLKHTRFYIWPYTTLTISNVHHISGVISHKRDRKQEKLMYVLPTIYAVASSHFILKYPSSVNFLLYTMCYVDIPCFNIHHR